MFSRVYLSGSKYPTSWVTLDKLLNLSMPIIFIWKMEILIISQKVVVRIKKDDECKTLKVYFVLNAQNISYHYYYCMCSVNICWMELDIY